MPIMAWLFAQVAKVAIDLRQRKKIDIKRFVGAGGMPSSHSAYVTSLATIIGIIHGFGSTEFGIVFAFAMIVMYDAAGVRRAAGKQAQVLNKLIEELEESGEIKNIDVKLRELLGHTPLQVVMGALVGIGFAFLFGIYLV